jgi:hypothetical protein
MKWNVRIASMVVVLAAFWMQPAQADPIPRKYRPAIKKGLDWLAAQQKGSGGFSANNEQYPVAMTSLAGMAFLTEGSTIRSGKYSQNVKDCVEYLMKKRQKGGGKDGLIGDTTNQAEATRYMYGHGFGTLFLACVYGDEDNRERREELKDALTRAVKYIANAQSTKGGWYYTSAKDGHNQDEGSVTITQIQALRACRNAGIPVPFDVIKKAQDYLANSTTQKGGVIYRLGSHNKPFQAVGGERPALTAAAISCAFGAGDYKSELVKKWFKFCQTAIPIGAGNVQFGHQEYTHYYYAQAVYILGNDGWEKLFPGEKNGVTWSEYREVMFAKLVREQNANGAWTGGGGFGVGPVYSTSMYLTILQLDNNILPIYQP